MFTALQKNTQFFYDPSEILTDGFVPRSTDIRIGGLVLEGSVIKDGGLKTTFKLADFPDAPDDPIIADIAVTVSYEGILPDLFREGQGIVVTGVLNDRDYMTATEVLAKHDENYQPKK